MERPAGTLPSFTKNNPRKRFHAITLKSGKLLDNQISTKDPKPYARLEE